VGESEQHAICPQQLSRPSPHGPRITTWSTLRYGERPEVAYGLPFSVDGMLVVATIVMVDDKRRTHRVRPMARLAFTVGVIASIAANIAAAHPTIGARIIDGWPALALLLVVEMLARPPAGGSSAAHVPAEVGRTAARAAELPPAATRPADVTSAATVPAEVTELAHVPAAPTVADVGARSLPAIAAPPAVRGVNPQTATGKPQLPTGAAVRASSDTAVPADRRFGTPVGSAEVPPAELPGHIVAAEPHAAEPEPAEHHASSSTAATAPESPNIRPRGTLRRPTATTRHIAHTIMAAEPRLSRTELADRLGVSTRRLREVLAA